MARVFVERRTLGKNIALTWDIAHHLYVRAEGGIVVIVAENPAVLLAALRKQWLKVVHKLHKEYAATLDPWRRDSLRRTIQYMETLRFTTDTSDYSIKRVYFVAPEEIQELLGRKCHTLYLTCEVALHVREKLFECLIHFGVVVDYSEDA